MRNIYYSGLLSLQIIASIILLSLANTSFSQDTENTDNTESPYFSVFCNDTSVVDFPLLSTNMQATISGVIANIEVEQVYANSGDSALDATYVFPMSTNAAIYRMQMVVDDRVIDAVIMRKAEAQEIFQEANDSGYTASLLEQHRPNVFQMSLANINSGDTVKVRMTYTELIEPEKGVYELVLPSIVGPRYTTNNEEWVVQTRQDSLAIAGTAWNIDLTINAGMPVFAKCKSHEASILNEGEVTHCMLETHPGKDFILDYTLSGNEIQTGLLLYEGESENFFLSIIQPPRPEVIYDSPRREYVFIMDVSGSMSGYPITVSKQLISNLLSDLNPDDKFNILFFAGGSAFLAQNSLPVTAENINSAIEMIENMNAGGGTELLPAMQRALNMEGTANYSRTFVILTDGYVTVERAAYQLIREHLNDANFFSFGIGRSVNREIIEGMAYVGEGESFVVTDDEDAYTMADIFKEYIERPALTNIETSFSGINAYDVEPPSIPDVFADRPIIIYGKYEDADNGSITVTGDYADGEVSGTFNFADYSANAEENIALQYLWARKRIKLMSDYGLASNENDTLSIEEEITRLGLQYSLVTAYTSFVAVDSSALADPNEDPSTNPEEWDSYSDIEDREYETQNAKPDFIQIIGSNAISGNIVNIALSDIEAYASADLQLRIIDMSGRVLASMELSDYAIENIIPFYIGSQTPGLYFVCLCVGDQVIDTEKIIILR